MTSVIVAGDLCPKDRVAHLFDEQRYDEVLGEVKPFVDGVDYAVVNLEAPIVMSDCKPIKKSGPNLKCSDKVIGAIKYAGFDGVTLANNHFYDYGEEGALTTFCELDANNIDYVGAGRNIEEASRTLYVEINGEYFAFINCCEHEFSIATEASAGSNPLDIIGQYNAIKDAKQKAQHVIVIVHGGIEMYQLPTPRMVKTYRFFIEVGADAVVNHHQHCFSGYEYYQGKPIVYGLGNFCFDWKGKSNDIWHQGYVAKLSFDNDGIHLSTLPYRQCDEKAAVRFSVVNQNLFEKQLRELNNSISNEQRLTEEYEKLLKRTWKNYDIMNPYSNRYINWLHKKGLLPSLMPRKKQYSILNSIRCESHQERLLYTLNKKL